jgi:hypothetical protein
MVLAHTSASASPQHRTHRSRPHTYRVFGTGTDSGVGLNERITPSADDAIIVGLLHDGQSVKVLCQQLGGLVTSKQGNTALQSDVWDEAPDWEAPGGVVYVSDAFITTPKDGARTPVGSFSTTLPRCDSHTQATTGWRPTF